ncbi:hypothetical protein O53_2811 [Microcystis aeruginosa TAIHU98]|uniref:Uncharacterized protein n=1 Tax=Microcystis aeruginosa TAIHU98 TaxID=1134457 RepID=L7E3H0_MICAE|nr:hypothetical protein O53_2811 [Microcystis aeruginosa TAIHU98]
MTRLWFSRLVLGQTYSGSKNAYIYFGTDSHYDKKYKSN